MVSTRHNGHPEAEGGHSDGEEEQHGGRDRRSKVEEQAHGRDSGRRRVLDPVMREAAKRGLDVDQLHSSQTPAWRNLRGRSRLKQASYYEGTGEEDDEIADHGSDEEERGHGHGSSGGSSEEEGSDPSSGGEDEDGEGTVQPRYSRRNRQTVQRYSPRREVKPAPRSERRRRYEEDLGGLSDLEQYDAGRHQQHTQQFAARYSVRERRLVEFYDPSQQDQAPHGSQPGSAGPHSGSAGRDRRHEEERSRKRSRHGRDSPQGAARGAAAGGRAEGEEDGEAEGQERRQSEERRKYSFRDRALVTINPTLNLSQLTSGLGSAGPGGGGAAGDRHGGSHPQHKRPRSERRAGGGSSRLRRVASRGHMGGRYVDEEEEDAIADHPASPWRAVQDGNRGHAGAGGQPGGAAWDVALAAAQGLPLNQYGREKGNAEITPLQVDPSVTFDTVGGLDHYIRALKEMIFLPLVYPELFERFHITPPRGVLFYGPPGTGKTLVARALAAHASRGAGRRVSFFMRKGADVLSKWVGEAERQLRLLFEEAQRHQPAIIFFDEIDGLAPVRSSKQDQIHNSIVSTLLALMDGLDSRGQVVVIGATNRIDALDGALRRPGRFDRELLFPLPNLSARADILRIHTRKWAQPPSPELVEELATLCVGYCGADLKSLCTEASLQALRRAYPQIYSSDDKLLVDPASVAVQARDFMAALRTITPASHRSAAAHARPLAPLVAPLLLDSLQQVLAQLQRTFPPAAACMASSASGGNKGPKGPSLPGEQYFPGSSKGAAGGLAWGAGAGVQRPRLLLCGAEGAGQSHVGPAVLYAMEGLPVHAIGLPSLLSDAGARSPEEALVHAVVEARRAAPAILFLPHLQVWWDTAPSSLRATLWMLLADLPPDLPLLLFATADVPGQELDPEARALFGGAQSSGIFELPIPTLEQRSAFFHDISRALALPPPPEALAAAAGEEAEAPAPPPLPRAPDAEAKEAAARKEAEERAARKRYDEDQAALRALRMALRDVLLRMLGSRKWEAYAEPVSPDEDPHYWNTVAHPMDLATLLSRVDARLYSTTHHFMADVALIPQGERQYWGVGEDGTGGDPRGVREVSRACALEDEIRTQLAGRLPAELVARLDAMQAAGGPAPPPPGLAELMAAPAVPFDGKTPGLPLRTGVGRPQSEGGAGSGRRATRLVQPQLDNRVVHTDPEEAMRRIRMLKKAQEAALAEALGSQQAQQGEGGGDHDAVVHALREEAAPAGAPQQAQQQHEEEEQHRQQQQQQQQQQEVGAEEAGQPEEGAVEAMQVDGGSAGRPAAARGVLAATTKDNLPERPAGEAPDGTVRMDASRACERQKAVAAPAAAAAQPGLAPVEAQRPGLPGTQQQQQAEGPAAGGEAAAAPVPLPAAPAEREASPADLARAEALQQALAGKTEGLLVEPLEGVHARLSRLAMERIVDEDREGVVQAALEAADGWLRSRAMPQALQ